MQKVSKLYRALFENIRCEKESKVEIAGEVYEHERILSLEVSGGLFQEESVCIGSACAREMDLVLRNPGTIPRAAEIKIFSRLRVGDQISEWIPKGVFYVDTRDPNPVDGTLTIHAFDKMVQAEQPWVPTPELSFPLPMDTAVTVILKQLGWKLDSRSVISGKYSVEYPSEGTTCRQILRWIAAAHGGNWTITEKGEARLVSLLDTPNETSLLVEEYGNYIIFGGIRIRVGPVATGPTGTGSENDKTFVGPRAAEVLTPLQFPPVSEVVLTVSDETGYIAGTDSGQTLHGECAYASQEMANDLLAKLSRWVYRPMTASDALVDPAVELGDGVTVNGVYTMVASLTTYFDGLLSADIGAPGQRESESEYGGFTGPVTQKFNRKVAGVHSELVKTEEEILLKVSDDLNGLSSSIDVTLDNIRQNITDTAKGLQSTIDQTASSIRSEISNEVKGLNSTIEQTTTTIRTEISNEVKKINSSIEQTATTIRSEISNEVKGLNSSIEQTASSLSTTISAVDGRVTTLSADLKGIQQSVQSIDGRVTTVEQTASGLTTSVQGLNGRMTTVETNVSGVKTSITGINGTITTIQATIKGLTVQGEYGTTYINPGSIQTGSITADKINANGLNIGNGQFVVDSNGNVTIGSTITLSGGIVGWNNLDYTTRSAINNAGLSQSEVESIAHTQISSDLIASPTIRGAKIQGATFQDLDGNAMFSCGRRIGGGFAFTMGSTSATYHMDFSDDSTGTSITSRGGFSISSGSSSGSFGLCSSPVLSVYKDSSGLTVTPSGKTWDFSRVNTTGLTAVAVFG